MGNAGPGKATTKPSTTKAKSVIASAERRYKVKEKGEAPAARTGNG